MPPNLRSKVSRQRFPSEIWARFEVWGRPLWKRLGSSLEFSLNPWRRFSSRGRRSFLGLLWEGGEGEGLSPINIFMGSGSMLLFSLAPSDCVNSLLFLARACPKFSPVPPRHPPIEPTFIILTFALQATGIKADPAQEVETAHSVASEEKRRCIANFFKKAAKQRSLFTLLLLVWHDRKLLHNRQIYSIKKIVNLLDLIISIQDAVKYDFMLTEMKIWGRLLTILHAEAQINIKRQTRPHNYMHIKQTHPLYSAWNIRNEGLWIFGYILTFGSRFEDPSQSSWSVFKSWNAIQNLGGKKSCKAQKRGKINLNGSKMLRIRIVTWRWTQTNVWDKFLFQTWIRIFKKMAWRRQKTSLLYQVCPLVVNSSHDSWTV